MGGSCFVLFFIWYEKVKVSKGVGGGYWFGVGRVGGMFVGGGGGTFWKIFCIGFLGGRDF